MCSEPPQRLDDARLENVSSPPLVDPERLAAWMDEQALAAGAPLTVERITTGHSNEVFP